MIIDAVCAGSACVVIADGIEPYTLDDGNRKIVVLDVNNDLKTVFHELAHALGADEEEAEKMEKVLGEYYDSNE